MMKPDEPDYTRIFLAVFLSAILLIGWQIKVEWPRRQALARYATEQDMKRLQEKQTHAEAIPTSKDPEENPELTREERLAASPRVAVRTEKLIGSIALKGARFDDLSLARYRVAPDTGSPNVTLMSPNGDAQGYFAQVGWLAAESGIKLPDQDSLWQADRNELGAGQTVNLRWDNGQGLTFLLSVTLDEDYMFNIEQKVENHSARAVDMMPYAYINRTYEIPSHPTFLHEGPLGVVDGSLNEMGYADLQEKGNAVYQDATGWFGISDHYWFTALIPEGGGHKVTFGHYKKNGRDRYQVDYLDETLTVNKGETLTHKLRLFAGAKELTLLDQYAHGSHGKGEPIPLFDRALDFGSFYFLAKPTCVVTDLLYKATGNFGIALLIFIIIVKILMFPLANKSYKSMAQMRALQPEMVKIREKYFDDQMALHRATRELYKREKVNPAAGCLPVLIQLVVFLALFRGLNVTIEMRHAPFLWVHDLSAPDPSNLFTLFGLVPWNTPGFLHMGLLPILYCITMVVQTRQQPKPADPVQAKMMNLMPYFLLFFFSSMAAGFVLYWTFSNILSIIQQHYITRTHGKSSGPALPSAANG